MYNQNKKKLMKKFATILTLAVACDFATAGRMPRMNRINREKLDRATGDAGDDKILQALLDSPQYNAVHPEEAEFNNEVNPKEEEFDTFGDEESQKEEI